ncbi:carbohydrate porin [Acetobacter sp. LMG 1636]|uniref:Carbohydrate porin n=1 Tax=Acetobacter fallax TaxID=1737473 RepID=A0ABX0KJ92_9PROT|nr:carbohydrate porin [Acetobacter fallax]NHO37497.1 carbohydrate porin [Acetobacter fallax]
MAGLESSCFREKGNVRLRRVLRAGVALAAVLCGMTAGGDALAADEFNIDDPFGWNELKQKWAKAGVGVSVSDAEEVWGIPRGGVLPSEHYIGATTVDLVLDPARLSGMSTADGAWGTFEISAVDIRGKPFSNYPLYAFNQTSTSEADPNLRLYELAYNWHSVDNRISVRVGKLDLSKEFMVSDTAQNFLNGSFGWPMLPSNDLYNQGPASPVAAPAVRLNVAFAKKWLLRLAVADDNATGARRFINQNDPWNQNQDPSGTKFWFGTGTFVIGELNRDVSFAGHAGTWKAGFFADSGAFPLQADSSVSRKGNWGVYVTLDHTLVNDTGMGALKGFVRWNYTGLSDRNQIASSLDAGLVLAGPFHRSDDSLGLGFGYAAPSHFLTTQRPDGSTKTMRNEYHIELTYTWQAWSWLSVQPDVQGLINPSGGVYDPISNRKAQNALIFGLHLGVSLKWIVFCQSERVRRLCEKRLRAPFFPYFSQVPGLGGCWRGRRYSGSVPRGRRRAVVCRSSVRRRKRGMSWPEGRG